MKKPPLKTSIPVNIPLQILVVEKSLTGLDISKGSHIYCGLCGHTIGRVNKDLQLPMPHEQLLKTMSGVKVQLVRTAKISLLASIIRPAINSYLPISLRGFLLGTMNGRSRRMK